MNATIKESLYRTAQMAVDYDGLKAGDFVAIEYAGHNQNDDGEIEPTFAIETPDGGYSELFSRAFTRFCL